MDENRDFAFFLKDPFKSLRCLVWLCFWWWEENDRFLNWYGFNDEYDLRQHFSELGNGNCSMAYTDVHATIVRQHSSCKDKTWKTKYSITLRNRFWSKIINNDYNDYLCCAAKGCPFHAFAIRYVTIHETIRRCCNCTMDSLRKRTCYAFGHSFRPCTRSLVFWTLNATYCQAKFWEHLAHAWGRRRRKSW